MGLPDNTLSAARLGRASARRLSQLTATHTLTEEEATRLLKRIEQGFDAVLGAEPPTPPPARSPFLVVHTRLS